MSPLAASVSPWLALVTRNRTYPLLEPHPTQRTTRQYPRSAFDSRVDATSRLPTFGHCSKAWPDSYEGRAGLAKSLVLSPQDTMPAHLPWHADKAHASQGDDSEQERAGLWNRGH